MSTSFHAEPGPEQGPDLMPDGMVSTVGKIGYSYLRVSSVGRAGADRDGIDRQASKLMSSNESRLTRSSPFRK